MPLAAVLLLVRGDDVSHSVATVIIPCWNGERHLADLIRSLLAQSRQDFDLILLDDASEDRSVVVAREVAGERIRIVQNERPLGLSGNWNRAFSLAKTDYVCLAHQDDIYEPHYLERMLDCMDQNPSAALAHCRARTIDEDGKETNSAIERFKLRFWKNAEKMDRHLVYQRLFHGNFVCCPSIMYRKEAHGAVGGFNGDLSFCTDWDFSFRILLAEMDMASVPEALLCYRRHRSNATRQHVASLDRYKEEARTLEMALKEGEARGLLGSGTHPSSAVRNNLLYDAFADFKSGDPGAALEKIRFGEQAVPGFRKDGFARVFRMCLRLGRPGAHLLSAGLWAYLWMAPNKMV